MEYTVSSLKDAIYVCLEKYDYDKNNFEIIRTLINSAIKGETKNFTRTAGARDYIKNSLDNNHIVKELIETTNVISNDINEIIEAYIDKFFRKKIDYNEIKNQIKEKTDLTKVKNKLSSLYKNVNDNDEFLSKRWNIFANIFSGNSPTMTSEELKYDMIYASLEEADFYREKATVLKKIDPKSEQLSKIDSIKIVEEYVYENKLTELFELLENNMCFAGHLLETLLDSFDTIKVNKFSLYELDKKLEKFDDLKIRTNILLQILNGKNLEGIDIEKERLIVDLLKNTLAINMYSRYEPSVDFYERKLYTGILNNVSEEVIQARIEENNRISNNLIINGINTTFEDLISFIDNLNDKEKYFLANIYVYSRSLESNKSNIEKSVHRGQREQQYVYSLLEKEELIELLKEEKQNIM